MGKEPPKYLLHILEFPGESLKVDYKAAIEFKENEEFSYTLTKHILGFANNDGGFIVIGYKDGNLSIDSNLTDSISKSYDTTRLAQFVNSCTANQDKIELIVHKIFFKNQTFPIVEIKPFRKYPFFVSDKPHQKGFGKTLKNGCIYLRDEEAKTVEVKDDTTYAKIIDKCVRLRQNETLIELKDLLDKATGQKTTNLAEITKSEEWKKEARLRALKGLENVESNE